MKLSRTLLNFLFGYFLSHLASAEVETAFEPVNRFFTAESPEQQPELECLVGIHSSAASEMYRVRCTEAWNISVQYDRKKANSLASAKWISEHDRRLRTFKFGIEGSGLKYNSHAYWKNWTAPIANWVCGYYPILGLVIFDCIPENQAPNWWKTPLMGPGFPTGHKPAPKEMRKPGCNGGVCYCNDKNYCNDRHTWTSEDEDCPDEYEHHKWDLRCKKQPKTEL